MPGQKGMKKSTVKCQPSKEIVYCPVDGCTFEKARFRMKNHFLNLVIYDDNERPYIPGSIRFNELSEEQKNHTRYFNENKFDKSTRLISIFPGRKFSSAPKLTPFERSQNRNLVEEYTQDEKKECEIETILESLSLLPSEVSLLNYIHYGSIFGRIILYKYI
ncbi:unnamed protein product [Meganyctiphanes norvegica]|uniref:Uncharacterized protein n=1 Tax=Meganyctiphanes norvegica TaxID=48144 RepID=A0AAV2RJ02_MEGNR